MLFDRHLSSSFVAFALIAGSQTVAAADDGRGVAGEHKANRCAVYGAGFVPIQGSDTCARIGGHVRVEVGNLVGGSNGELNHVGSDDGARPASLNSRQNAAAMPFDGAAERSHLRVRALPGSRDLFAR